MFVSQEFLDVLATVAGNPPRYPALHYSGAEVHILPWEPSEREPSAVVEELLSRPFPPFERTQRSKPRSQSTIVRARFSPFRRGLSGGFGPSPVPGCDGTWSGPLSPRLELRAAPGIFQKSLAAFSAPRRTVSRQAECRISKDACGRGGSAAKQSLTGPAKPRCSVCAPGRMGFSLQPGPIPNRSKPCCQCGSDRRGRHGN